MRIRKDYMGFAFLLFLAAANHWLLIPGQVLAEGSETFYPYLLNTALVILLPCYAWEIWRSRGRNDAPLFWEPGLADLGRILCLLGGIWLWADAMKHLGFILPTAFFLALCGWLYGEKSVRKLALLALVSPFVLYALFTMLGAALPQGGIEIWLSPLLVR
ncbi:tripartite tricarboxylate transporter TctB family protein [Desulfovibrio sp. SGI.169]|uniref:tripartite tricarboxylate transporter TctB family protein n=1 Tax=Desulfovibrio sp. SGI.169 TaxID=3420561 RepID=UPI003D06E35E